MLTKNMPRRSSGAWIGVLISILAEYPAEERPQVISIPRTPVHGAALSRHTVEPGEVAGRWPVVGVGRPLDRDVGDLPRAAAHEAQELGVVPIHVIAELQ